LSPVGDNDDSSFVDEDLIGGLGLIKSCQGTTGNELEQSKSDLNKVSFSPSPTQEMQRQILFPITPSPPKADTHSSVRATVNHRQHVVDNKMSQMTSREENVGAPKATPKTFASNFAVTPLKMTSSQRRNLIVAYLKTREGSKEESSSSFSRDPPSSF